MGIILFNVYLLNYPYHALYHTGFRPLMGIILFNMKAQNAMLMKIMQEKGFRPLMGIILFNYSYPSR